MHAALQVESPLERDPRHRVVVHDAVGAALAHGDGPGNEEVDRADDQRRDHDQTGANGREHRQVTVSDMRSRGWTPDRPRRAPPAPGCDHAPTAAAAPPPRRTARTSRRRSTHSIRTHSPYRSPSKSNRWASSVRRPSWKVGRGPWFIMPPARPPRHSTRTAYTPSGGSSFCGGHLGQVDRRDADQPAAPLALAHPAAHLVRPSQHPRRGGEIAAGDGAPDARAGDVLLADVHRVDHVHLEAVARRRAGAGSRRRRFGRGRSRDRARSRAPRTWQRSISSSSHELLGRQASPAAGRSAGAAT